MPSAVISHYEIINQIGEGGMGKVFLAQDLTLHRKVVIKTISPKIAKDGRARRRLIREARAASALDHPNVCTIYEVGEFEGETFIVMQYVDGEVLRTYTKNHPLEVSKTLDIFTQIANGLAASHRKGVIHRDIKPDNIMVDAQGLVKVLDFGLAIRMHLAPVSLGAETESLLSQRNEIAGTLPYMSPEQARGEELDASSDIFSAGTVMYEVCAGRHPFARRSSAETISAILTIDPAPIGSLQPDIPETLDNVIRQCLEKDRQKRFRDGAALAAELSRVKTAIETDRILPALRGPARASVRSPLILASAALLLFALIAGTIGYLKVWRSRSVIKPVEIQSLAVLPLDDRGTDNSVSYLSDGLTDSLINNLAEISEVKVIARNSVFRYKGKDITPEAVARELNVQALLWGKLTQEPDGFRINVELVDTRDSSHIWGGTYPFKSDEALKIEETIAREVSSRLRFGLAARNQQNGPKNYTNDYEAYQLYLKGRFFWNKRTAEDLKKSLEYFDQAIARDPSYALAYAGMADTYVLLGSTGYNVLLPKDAMTKAEAAANKALEIDAALAEAHNSAATVKFLYTWDFPQAEPEFQKAISLKPNLAIAHYWYSIFLMYMGRREESISESKKAQEIDPLSLIVNVNVARAYHFARRYDETIELCKRVIDLDDKFVWSYYILGSTYAQKGMYKEAIKAFQRCLELLSGNTTFLSAMAYTYALSGNKQKAGELLQTVKNGSRPNPAEVAIVYLGLGDIGRAFQLLEQAFDERSNGMLTLKVSPVYDVIRGDQRFVALLARVGFTPAN